MTARRLLWCVPALVAGLTIGGTEMALAAPSPAQCGDVGCPSPAVPEQPSNGPMVASTGHSTDPTGGLAFTGADIMETTVFALGVLAAGSALVYSSRRARRTGAGG